MLFLSSLLSLVRPGSNKPARASAPPGLEHLEDRLTPAATNQDFVASAVQALANRGFTPADQGIVNQLNAGQINILDAAALIERSDDAINFNVKDMYNRLLLRQPDPVGQAFFFGIMKAGTSLQEAKAIMVSSPEYFQLQAGNSNDKFISAVFADFLGRGVDPTGQAYYSSELNSPVLGTAEQRRQLVARQVINSDEGAEKEARVLYNNLLLRSPDPSGLRYFTSLLTASIFGPPVSEQEVLARFVGSQEFFDRS